MSYVYINNTTFSCEESSYIVLLPTTNSVDEKIFCYTEEGWVTGTMIIPTIHSDEFKLNLVAAIGVVVMGPS